MEKQELKPRTLLTKVKNVLGFSYNGTIPTIVFHMLCGKYPTIIGQSEP